MMKKLCIFCFTIFTLIFVSCKKENNTPIIQDIPVAKPQATSQENINTNGNIDIDMTKMSSTMIYAEVFNMLIMPEEYANKNIKVKGNFQVFENGQNGERFFAILIPDATKCCQQGIEFVWQGNHSYPHDYPAINEEIIISGTYNCMEYGDGATYTYLDVWQIDRK